MCEWRRSLALLDYLECLALLLSADLLSSIKLITTFGKEAKHVSMVYPRELVAIKVR